MEEAEQGDFLRFLLPASQGIGFAVLGGSFAEGIDLPGKRLAAPLLRHSGYLKSIPSMNRSGTGMDTIFHAGYEYAYFFPGMQKVVQAAGRVIRTQWMKELSTLLMTDSPGPRSVASCHRWWKMEQPKKKR